MLTTYRTLRVFISSPGDVRRERKAAESILRSLNTTCKKRLGLSLEVVTWSDLIPKTTRLPSERIQDILNREIPSCEIFILILWKRYGSKEPEHARSNTEREVEIALDLIAKKENFTLLSYFKRLPKTNDAGPQRTSAERFRERLKKEGVWFANFKKPNDFRDRFAQDLFETVLSHRLSTRKHRALQRFWVLGTPDRPTHPTLVILYPSIHRAFMGPVDDEDVWLNRLDPNIVFEDYKALSKLQKTLQMLGIRDYRVCNTADVPRDIRFMNRFWICLPRNKLALDALAEHSAVARFEFVPSTPRADSLLKWTSSDGNKVITIQSPLAKYLKEQRAAMAISGEWHRALDDIVAKDYAILARLKVRDGVSMEEGALQDYFLAGLRGLGTWGAAWFIDRQFDWFRENLEEGEDFQILLEVEYRDGKIWDVRDVSNESEQYFLDECRLTRVRRNIRKYREARA